MYVSSFEERWREARAQAASLEERWRAVRRWAVPIPWEPPIPEIEGIPYRRYMRPLIAEVVVSRLHGVVPALEAADPRWAAEARRLIRILEAAAACRVEADEARPLLRIAR